MFRKCVDFVYSVIATYSTNSCKRERERKKTLTVRVENSSCGFQKTLNVRLEIGPLIREFATPLQKDLKEKELRKSRIEASAIEFLKGSYQSVSPKTLKEGGYILNGFMGKKENVLENIGI